jgi:hypothetical protein
VLDAGTRGPVRAGDCPAPDVPVQRVAAAMAWTVPFRVRAGRMGSGRVGAGPIGVPPAGSIREERTPCHLSSSVIVRTDAGSVPDRVGRGLMVSTRKGSVPSCRGGRCAGVRRSFAEPGGRVRVSIRS